MKTRFIAYITLILSICLLTSCGGTQASINIKAETPPKTQMHFLMKIDKKDVDKYKEPRNTELLKYYEDGYACADIFLKDNNISFSTQLPDSHNIIFRFWGKYDVTSNGGIKLVLTDQYGNILKVSKQIAIYDADNSSYVKDIEWDIENNVVSLGESCSLYRKGDFKTVFLMVIKQEEVWLVAAIIVITVYFIKKKKAEKRH